MDNAAARREVIARYAQLDKTGRPCFCGPSRAERTRGIQQQGPGTNGKVIYPDRATAELAARELEAVGSHPLRAYLCQRSRRGHCHLTTDRPVNPAAHRRPPPERPATPSG